MGASTRIISPPKATLTRRSQSYSDFHDAVRAVLGPDGKSSEISASNLGNEGDFESDLDFVDWYHGLENELLDACHNEYQ